MAADEPVIQWFRQRFGEPTAVQRQAWPLIAAGGPVLLSAPTGSGKTLAAYLPILQALLADAGQGVQVIHVAPYRALIADARRNLRLSLRQLRAQIPAAPELRVGVRTGDSTPRQRQTLRRRPPTILLTTPESLAVMLSQPTAPAFLSGVRWVVIDEVHALAAGKRGADLALSLERLDDLAARPVQRIGLSATCAPLREAARFLAGPAGCNVTAAADAATLELTIEPLACGPSLDRLGSPPGFLGRLVDRLEVELRRNRTTLVFTNSRGQAERLTWTLRRRFPDLAIGVHHSALAAERRRRVERLLKKGRLDVVVSSTSLELGIDCGTVDGVVLVHPPGEVARLLQRVGRSGHAPGRPRRGLVLTATTAELLETAVTAAAGRSGQLEPLRVPDGPLDVLCQQLVGMAMTRPWRRDEAFDLVRRAYPYRHLTRDDFDACLAYLSGRCGEDAAALPARLQWQDDVFQIIDRRTARLLLRNLGTILAEDARSVEIELPADQDGWPTRRAVGEVDEPFADRLQAGDRFLLDGRCLEYRRKAGRSLLVAEVLGRPATPRWQGSGWPMSAELARRLYLLRMRAAEALRDGPDALDQLLRQDYRLAGPAVAALAELFEHQERVSEIPDAAVCLVEVIEHDQGSDYYCHTPLNRSANEALAWVAAHRLQGRADPPQAADLGFVLPVRGEPLSAEDFLRLLDPAGFETDLEAVVEQSTELRERFRQAALVGLMLLRNPLGGRRKVGGHDWAERRLFDRVRHLDHDFVLLRQARREVRDDRLDCTTAREYAESLKHRTVRLRRLLSPSPLAETWSQRGPGGDEVTPADALERLQAALLACADGPALT